MQLFALDSEGEAHFADMASRRVDYFCPECQGILRLREGEVRRPHFYHLQQERPCNQKSKSLEHLQVQLRLSNLIPCQLERRFPSINRIADVVFEQEKLIFEVQCSPITLEEIKDRNRDYARLGYQVIWIFHDQRYNQRKVTKAERVPHYYTNINKEGMGIFYDQFEGIRGHLRLLVLPPLPVDFSKPRPFPSPPSLRAVEERKKLVRCSFAGDLANLLDPEYLKRAQAFEARSSKKGFWSRVQGFLKVFEWIVLERFCG